MSVLWASGWLAWLPLMGLTGPTPQTTPTTSGASYLYQPAFCLDNTLRGPALAYDLQPGDICFAVNSHVVSKIGHHLSGAGLPNHSMIAFAFPDGRMGILEAGPHSRPAIEAMDALCHLASYEDTGDRVWVRRRTTSLTPEQSHCLTEFCLAQPGKRFATVRMVGQLTPFRARMPIRTAWVGKPNLNKHSFFCSELVLTSLVAAGVLDAEPLRPSATFPSDLFFGRSSNIFVARGLRQLECGWEPPARWSACPIHVDVK